jgi:peptidoglycan/xylan/chitin deacetylase (PgdA/CDA1 family)
MNLFFHIILVGLFFKEPIAVRHLLYKQVPVLCYHNITKNAQKQGLLWISEQRLIEQLKALHDMGYHTILPDQLYRHLLNGTPLPNKPVILSFDDTHTEHFSLAADVLKKYDYKAVFFIMTVCIGKKGYLGREQIKALSDQGHIIGCHTYNHPFVTKLRGKQWEQQIDKPKKMLEAITGRPVEYFAYPYGAWNEAAINELKARHIKAAFQLLGKESERAPLYSIRRMMVPGNLAGKELVQSFSKVFNPAEHYSR